MIPNRQFVRRALPVLAAVPVAKRRLKTMASTRGANGTAPAAFACEWVCLAPGPLP